MAADLVTDQLVTYAQDPKVYRIDEVKQRWMMPTLYSITALDGSRLIPGLHANELTPVAATAEHKFKIGDEVDFETPPRRCRVEGLIVTVNPDGKRYLYQLLDLASLKDSWPTRWRAFDYAVRKPGARVMNDVCPRCGDRGEWRMLALFCTKGHGRFAG